MYLKNVNENRKFKNVPYKNVNGNQLLVLNFNIRSARKDLLIV